MTFPQMVSALAREMHLPSSVALADEMLKIINQSYIDVCAVHKIAVEKWGDRAANGQGMSK